MSSPPTLLVTRAELLGVSIGCGTAERLAPFGWYGWSDVVRNARSGLRPDGTPMPRDELLALQKLADVGLMLREAGCRVAWHDGPLPPLEERLAALQPAAKEYLAGRSKRPARKGKKLPAEGEPVQGELFREGRGD